MDVIYALLTISIILFLGFFAESLFRRTHIPDVIFLLIIGFVLGPHVLGFADPSSFGNYASIFTTFALIFMLYQGAFNMDLESLLKGAIKGMEVTLANFFFSSALIAAVLLLVGFDIFLSILAGFMLGGISSAFVIPVIKELKVRGVTYSMLTIESAVTDVLCIVFAISVMQIILINEFSIKLIFLKMFWLFAVAGIIGIIGGCLWIALSLTIFKHNKSYVLTIAYLILVYVIAEFFNGNGAIAALFFGTILKNSKTLTGFFAKVYNFIFRSTSTTHTHGITVTHSDEKFFYTQLSFLLKTFFFVYIGMLFDISDYWVLFIGAVITLLIILSRQVSKYFVKDLTELDQQIVRTVFARGLAAAAIAQILIVSGIPRSQEIASIVYAVIIFTMVASSVGIFIVKTGIFSKNKINSVQNLR